MKKEFFSALLLLLLIFAGCSGVTGRKFIEIQGSDTMVNVSMAWAQDFMKQNPQIGLSVDGGGSSVGIQSLINGTTDIATASRNIKEEETTAARQKGFTPLEKTVGYDGIVVAVNKNNPISKLTISELAKIFTGKVTNWQQLGGKDSPIVLFSRESSSGTYEFFKDNVLNYKNNSKEANFAASASLLNNSSQIVEQIESNENAIGYFGMGYATPSIKKIAVSASKNGPYIKPSVQTVRNKQYTISRPLLIYTRGKPKGVIKKYIEFLLSPRGQRIIKSAGFVPCN